MTLGDLLAAIVERVGNLSPVRVVAPWELGARSRLGRLHGRTLQPGVYALIPLIDRIDTCDASVAAIATTTQTIETSDGATLALSVIARYRVVDFARVLRTIYEVDEVARHAIEASVADCASVLNYHDSDQTLMVALPDHVYRDLRGSFEEWGLELIGVGVHTMCPVRAWRLIE